MIVLSIAVALGAHASCGEWALVGNKINGSAAGDESGQSVSLSDDGKIVALGASSHKKNGNHSGETRIYTLKKKEDGEEVWEQRGSSIYGEAQDSRNGYSVSLSGNGNRVAIGEYYHTVNNGLKHAGRTRIFDYNGSAWIQAGDVINGEINNIWSGSSVSLSKDGNRVAIGAWKYSGDTGQTRIYVFGDDFWFIDKEINGEASGDSSGKEVSLSGDGNTVAIGAYKHNGANGIKNNSGHVQFYRYNGSVWNKLGSDIDGENADDLSGYAVKLSNDGNTVAIGAYEHDGANGTKDNSGHVRIYDWDEDSWKQRGNNLDGENANDQSGFSVDISGDGNIVAIGAIKNAGNGELDSGHVRIYHWKNAAWEQRGKDIDGVKGLDQSGFAVSLSNDGNIVAIGANKNDDNGPDSGNVGIYRYVACASPSPPLAVSSSTSSTQGTIATVATAAFFQFALL